jgi:putative ABC transport system substrate-binding protein
MSYGPDLIDNYRRAAGYVDRVLKGENLKTAKALGLSVPSILQQRADELIE